MSGSAGSKSDIGSQWARPWPAPAAGLGNRLETSGVGRGFRAGPVVPRIDCRLLPAPAHRLVTNASGISTEGVGRRPFARELADPCARWWTRGTSGGNMAWREPRYDRRFKRGWAGIERGTGQGRMNEAARGVLIVEDDSDIREALTQILEEEGYPVDSAPNGKVGLDRLHERPPCLILLDLMMPVMNGWQFREGQRKDPSISDIPVVVISADGGARREAEAMGAHGFMQKPVGLNELLDMVSSLCRKQQPN